MENAEIELYKNLDISNGNKFEIKKSSEQGR